MSLFDLVCLITGLAGGLLAIVAWSDARSAEERERQAREDARRPWGKGW